MIDAKFVDHFLKLLAADNDAEVLQHLTHCRSVKGTGFLDIDFVPNELQLGRRDDRFGTLVQQQQCDS